MSPKQYLKLEKSGLELSKDYYEKIGKPVFQEKFPQYIKQIAIGLVGEGSECFGFDDILSMDHDYGPSFCIWLPEKAFTEVGAAMQKAYLELPKEFEGSSVKYARKENLGRRGVHEITGFYAKYLGMRHVPETWQEWISLPEHYLATATNGEVFEDYLGEFTKIREELLRFYPEDVRRKKIAAKAITMAHTGQCNYGRMMCRGDVVAAGFALNDFIKAAIAVVYLLNKTYMPYYKWMWQEMRRLPRLSEVADLLETLIRVGTDEGAWGKDMWDGYPHGVNYQAKAIESIERIASLVAQEMRNQGMSESEADYLEYHAVDIMRHIETKEIRELSIFYG